MTILIKQVRVVDPYSPFNGQLTDIFIEDGIITEISNHLSRSANKEISGKGLFVSPGWVDVFANFADPGYEFKETLETGATAAAAGGYTDVLVIPNTNPVIHNKAAVEYIVQKSKPLPVTFHPIGAITQNAEGKELAEMYDMKASGAVAFSDGLNTVQSAGLLVKALQYIKAVDGILMQLPDDKSINPYGLMNEGIVSTQLGLPGKPAMAEELMVERDIKLADYASSKLHFTGVSTKKSIGYIKQGKETGVEVSCSVTPYHLYFCDEDLKDYDSNLKVNPPLRTKEDRAELLAAVIDGTVDCIASHHLPHEYDSKVLEFEYAKNGMTGIETTYAVLNTVLPDLPPERLVTLLSINPRRLFNLEPIVINIGNKSVLTIFNPAEKWTVREQDVKSKSKNSPFIGVALTGKVAGIINGNKIVFD